MENQFVFPLKLPFKFTIKETIAYQPICATAVISNEYPVTDYFWIFNLEHFCVAEEGNKYQEFWIRKL